MDNNVPLWVTLLAAGIPALGAVIAAIVAARSARRAREAQLSSEAERDLRRQLAGVKGEIYEPIIEFFRKMMDGVKSGHKVNPSDQKTLDTLSKFAAWLAIYGSDGAITSFHKFMQASFHGSPPEILMYYYGSFLVATRKDLGYPATRIGVVDVMGLRITDAWTMWGGAMGLPEPEFLAGFDWVPPWPTGYGDSRNDE